MPSKYKAVRTEVDGYKFASKAEARRYAELKLLVKAGEISRRFRSWSHSPRRVRSAVHLLWPQSISLAGEVLRPRKVFSLKAFGRCGRLHSRADGRPRVKA